jgi:hypothetical protein
VSSVPVYCRQRNSPGLMWTATMKSLVGYAGPLERDHSPDGDFNRTVIAIASQPFGCAAAMARISGDTSPTSCGLCSALAVGIWLSVVPCCRSALTGLEEVAS